MPMIVAHLFIHPGQEDAYRAFEEQALARFRAHGGEVLAALRPRPNSDGSPTPHEIHVLRMGSEEAFAAFRVDAVLQSLAKLRARAIARNELFISRDMIDY